MVTTEVLNEPSINSIENFFDLLNRDQRTIKTIDRTMERNRSGDSRSSRNFPRNERHGEEVVDSLEISNSVSNLDELFTKFRNRNWGPRKRRRLSIHHLASRLGEVLVVGVCLLTLVRVPTVRSAPSTRLMKTTEKIHSHKGGHKAPEEPPSYMYPCGKSHEEEMNMYYSNSRESDPAILQHIILRTKSALSYAESFRDRYVESTFHLSFDQHHAQWANQKYDWLPNEGNGIPKRLGKNVDRIHLESKTFDEFLVNIYEHLQKFAVGLEQVVEDQKQTNGKFQENFRKVEIHLRNVLCEIRLAMIERNVTPNDQVPRSIMKDDFRHLESASYRNLRDWFIFRDMMNSLEYVIQVFTFIEENLPPSPPTSSS